MENYFVLYDLKDNVICYFENINEFSNRFNYPLKEINRKYRNSKNDFINLIIDKKHYKLYSFC